MKVKVLKKFVDSAEENVIRTVGDEFTVSKDRFDEIKNAGSFVKEIKVKTEPKKLVKDDDGRKPSSGIKSS